MSWTSEDDSMRLRAWARVGIGALVAATLLVLLMLSSCPTPAPAACTASYCQNNEAPMRTHITNTHRQIVGDLYTPVPGQRTQIRDKHRRVLGYIETNGTITNTHRQKIGETNGR